MTRLEKLRARLAVIVARLAEIQTAAAEGEGRTLSDQEATEVSGLEAEETQVKRDIGFEERMIARAQASAQPVAQRPVVAAQSLAPVMLTKTTQAQRNGDRWQGQSGTRMALCRVLSQLALKKDGRLESPAEIAAARYASRPELAQILAMTPRQRVAADQAGFGAGSGEPGAELLQLDATFSGDFITFLYARTVWDRLSVRKIPADVRVKGQDGASTGYFVGESKAIPMTTASFSEVDLRPLKVAALAAFSREILQRSSPDIETLVADSLREALTQRVDTKAFSTDAASSGVSPAGLLQGLTGQASAGGNLASFLVDWAYMSGIMIAGKTSEGNVIVTTPGISEQIGLLRNEHGDFAFPGMDENGGTILGKKALTGHNIPSGNLLRINPSNIYEIGASGVQIDLSTDATLEFGTAPTATGDGPADQSENPVSLFQTDMVGIRLVRDFNYAYRRAQAITTARITAADYDGTASTTD
jgi:HK97 family phage major capsid protein